MADTAVTKVNLLCFYILAVTFCCCLRFSSVLALKTPTANRPNIEPGSGTDLDPPGITEPKVILSKAISFSVPPKYTDLAIPENDMPIGTNGLNR